MRIWAVSTWIPGHAISSAWAREVTEAITLRAAADRMRRSIVSNPRASPRLLLGPTNPPPIQATRQTPLGATARTAPFGWARPATALRLGTMPIIIGSGTSEADE